MVTAAELLADLRQRQLGHLTNNIHGHVTGGGDLLVLALAPQGVAVQLVEPGHLLDDGLRRGQKVLFGPENVPHRPDGVLHIHLGAHQLLEGHDLVDHALNLPHVGGDVFRHVGQHRVGEHNAPLQRLVFQNGHTGLVVRGLNVRGEALLESGLQTLLQPQHLLGRAVGGEDDLFFLLIQGIKGVEQLLLAGVLAGDELHVVHQKQVHRPILVPEALHVVAVAQIRDELVDEVLAFDVHDPVVGVMFPHPVGDGVEQVGLAQPRLAVDKQGVIGPARLVGHLHSGGEGEFVGGAHHKSVEGVLLEGGVPGLGGAGLAVLVPLLGEHQGHRHVKGEQLPQSVFHRGQKPGADDVALKFGGDAENEAALIQSHRLHVAKPGFDGHGGHVLLHQSLYFFPYVSS